MDGHARARIRDRRLPGRPRTSTSRSRPRPTRSASDPGYKPFVSRAFRREEKAVDRLRHRARARPGAASPRAVATVLRPDGKPLGRARVYSIQYERGPQRPGRRRESRRRNGREDRTGPTARSPIPRTRGPGSSSSSATTPTPSRARRRWTKSPEIQARPTPASKAVTSRRPSRAEPGTRADGLHPGSRRRCLQPLPHGRRRPTPRAGSRSRRSIPDTGLRVTRRDRTRRTGRRLVDRRAGPRRARRDGAGHPGRQGRPVVGRVEPPAGWSGRC